MKRLKFNKEFKDVYNELQRAIELKKLIPESYKVDNKEFEMTDGNKSYKVRWEGTLTEGRVILLSGTDVKMVNEDLQKMKHLMGYKSQDTLGLIKGNARIDENNVFLKNLEKTKVLLETEDIEGQTAKTGDLSDAVSSAPEAKKHIKGSESSEKKTNAPEPKEGEWEEIEKPHAAEAKKHIEGSVATEKKTNAPEPKEGEWEKIKKTQPSEAKKDVNDKKVTAPTTAKVVKENEEPEEEDSEGSEEADDNYYKADDDDSATDVEPNPGEIAKEVPIAATSGDDDDDTAVVPPVQSKSSLKLFKNPGTGEYFLLDGKKHALKDDMGEPIPVKNTEKDDFIKMAKENPKLALTKIQDAIEFGDYFKPQESQEPNEI